MIEKNDKIISMLKNVIEQNAIILNDFVSNGSTHCAYVLEKLNRAKYDLDVLIKIANNKLKEENKRLGLEDNL